MNLSMILACTPNGDIGYQNTIPWRLRGDLTRFKEITVGHTVVMGRSTYESLPGPLLGRTQIVVTSSEVLEFADNTYFVKSIHDAIALAEVLEVKELFFIGGKRIYEEALPLVSCIHLTLVHCGEDQPYDTTVEGVFTTVAGDEWNAYKYDTIYLDPPSGMEITPSHTYFAFVKNTNPNVEMFDV